MYRFDNAFWKEDGPSKYITHDFEVQRVLCTQGTVAELLHGAVLYTEFSRIFRVMSHGRSSWEIVSILHCVPLRE